MTWFALRALVDRVPRVVWLVVILALVGWALYIAGQRAGEVTVKRIVLQDSVTHAVQTLNVAVRETEGARSTARTVKRWSDSSRIRRAPLREAVDPLMDSLPAPVVALIKHDDQQIRRDSATIVAFVSADSAWLAERFARIDVDTLRVHQIDLGRPVTHHGRTAVLVGTVVAVGALLLLHLAVR